MIGTRVITGYNEEGTITKEEEDGLYIIKLDVPYYSEILKKTVSEIKVFKETVKVREVTDDDLWESMVG